MPGSRVRVPPLLYTGQSLPGGWLESLSAGRPERFRAREESGRGITGLAHSLPRKRPMKPRLIVLACAALMACGTTTDVSTQFIGTFFLQSVNGNSLPFVVTQNGTSSTSLTSDQLTIADGGTWSETGIERTVVN